MVSARDIYTEGKKAKKEATKKPVAAKKPPIFAEPTAKELEELETLAADSYQDQEDEWNDVAPQIMGYQEQSEARGIMQDLHGAKKGDTGTLASRTRLVSRDQAAAMMELRVMAKHYPKFGIEDAPEWLESYNVSLEGKGRQEDVEVLRGQVSLAPPGDVNKPRTW